MKTILTAALMLTLTFLSLNPLHAGELTKNIPPIIIDGLKQYASEGPEAAIRTWIKGSAMEEKTEESLSYAKSFKEIEKFYGKYITFKLIEITEIAETSRVITISMDFERGPIYAKFLAYKSKQEKFSAEWILVSFDFNTKPEIIIPALFIR
ncbi:MAG: hypothetical protein IME96_05130 [Proteobacteria bacterium]|nr:hypothetical protein [Pseudomonadota bacterium]